jgi:hypothetical protein
VISRHLPSVKVQLLRTVQKRAKGDRATNVAKLLGLIASLGILSLATGALAADISAVPSTGSKPALATMLSLVGIVSIGFAVLVPSVGRAVSANEIANLTWDESNITALRSATLSDVGEFINRVLCDDKDTKDCGPIEVRQFAWADIEGKGKYALVDVWDTGGKEEGIGIYQKNSSARVQENEGDLTPAIPGYITQSIDIDGYGYEGPLADKIRDLDGDGKKELLVNSGFEIGRTMAETPLIQWPKVYRWQDGRYIEASSDFTTFYDKEVLSPLEERIAAVQRKVDSESEAVASGETVRNEYHTLQEIESHMSPEQARAVDDLEQLALAQSLRDHILLVLGRGLTPAQEKEAREWLKSPDHMLLEDAETTFRQMGGHEAEVLEAQQAKLRMARDFLNSSEEKARFSPAPAPPTSPGNTIGTVH